MAAAAPAHVIGFLRRAGLVVAVLALIAGIFGMHVMTATHAMHSPATAAAAGGAHYAASTADHASDHASGLHSARDTTGPDHETAAGTGHCAGSGDCSSMQAMSASCTPSLQTSSLAAPLPGTGISFRTPVTAALSAVSAQWSYRPGSPSPGDLCISRT
jgi:hypothetical protein